MGDTPKRTPTGAAVLQPEVTEAITDAVLDELAAAGYGRLSMEAVARRAGVGKSALYRRWPSKQEMAMAVLSQISVERAVVPDTGSLHGDLLVMLHSLREWMTDPLVSRILPDLAAEGLRNPDVSEAVATAIGEPRRARGAVVLRRSIERGELPPDTDLEMALDLVAAPIHWRLSVRHAPTEPGYLEHLAEHLLRALGATPRDPADPPAG